MQQARLEGQHSVRNDLSVFASDEAFWPCNYTDLPSTWYEHVPLAYWMVKAVAPACLVELGTHYGLSYLSFCEAIDRLGLATSAYAVDTWQGDEHAGFYGEEVYFKLTELHDPRFSRFSRLVRSTFDGAVGQFAAGSIDLLHIDGLHTYEAVKHDFETWRPKLAQTAVVLFHDTNVRERGFGVWKLWQELAGSHPHFEFLHGHGLGVLGIGGNFSPAINALFAAAAEPKATQQVRSLFARLGALVSQQASLGRTVPHLVAEVGRRDARITELVDQAGASGARVAELSGEIAAREARIAELVDQAGASGARIAELSGEIAARDAEIVALRQEADSAQAACGEARAEAASHATRMDGMQKSVSWQLTHPLRWRMPRKPRKKLKRAWKALRRRTTPASPRPYIAPPLTAAGSSRKPCVIFLSGEPDTPGQYYRVDNIFNALAPRYFERIVIRNDELAERVDECARADLLWIWRTIWTKPLARAIELARGNNARVVFDVDDLMFRPDIAKTAIIDGIRSQDLTEEMVARGYSLIRRVLAHADHATAPTNSLAHELRGDAFKPASVIPNGFDRHALALAHTLRLTRGELSADGWLRIGYASGSRTHQRDLAVALPAIIDILQEYERVRLVLFEHTIDIAEFPQLAPFADRIEWRPLVPIHELLKEYARFDINIAPLEVGNPFCEAKSELKFFEPALVGVVTVASPTRPFREAIRPGHTGFLAATRVEWRQCLKSLIDDPDLRRRTAEAALAEVLWHYGPERRSVLVNRLVGRLLAPLPVAAEVARTALLEPQPPAKSVDVPPFEVVYASPRRRTSRVAVVVPLHNYARYVGEALDSVAAQTVRDLDVIVVDDRSTDESLQVARTWLIANEQKFNHVALLQNRENVKLSRTRNVGIYYSATELVLPLDADNQLLPTCVERCMALLDETNAAMAYPTIEMFGDKTGLITEQDWDPARFQFGNYIDAMAMFRKACWLVVGGYSPLQLGWEDWDLWCKFVEAGFWGVRVPEVTARYRVHGTSMLRRVTLVPENYQQAVTDLASLHPWLDISPLPPEECRPSPVEEAEERGGSTNTDRPAAGYNNDAVLAILRCPETGEPLERDGDELRSVRSGRRWPIVDGRPVFTKEGRNVQRHPPEHVSNPLPEQAIALIESTKGPVLNLSGGAASLTFGHVIEVEYSLFRTTNVAADAHRLPFGDAVFDAVICLNAFEHFRDPQAVAEEIRRVLRPGGKLFIHTAFMQPLHEAPHHYFNCTKYGLREWLKQFSIEQVRVSNNFNPAYAFSWLASDLEAAFAASVSEKAAANFRSAPVGSFASLWRDEGSRQSPLWQAFFDLPDDVQERFAAGWEVLAHRPADG